MTKAQSRTKARSSQVDKGGNIPNREGDKGQAIGSDAGKFEGGQECSTSTVSTKVPYPDLRFYLLHLIRYTNTY